MRITTLTLLSMALALLCLSVLDSTPSYGQDSMREPSPEITISTDSFDDIVITYLADSGSMGANMGDTLKFEVAGITLIVTVFPDAPSNTFVNVLAEGEQYGLGDRRIELYSSGRMPEQVDASALPTGYFDIWSTAKQMVAEAVENEDFREFIGTDEDNGYIWDRLEEFTGGEFMPQFMDWEFAIIRTVGHWFDGGNIPSRGYDLIGPGEISITTIDPYGEPDPAINISTRGTQPEERWNFYLDPETGTCTVSWDSNDPYEDDAWHPAFDEVVATLLFFNDNLASYSEAGLLEDDTELELFLLKGLEWLDVFTIVTD